MAKRKGNKTEAVREYLKAHPNAKSLEISEALGKKGIKITPAYVSNIKTTLNKRRGSRKVAKAEPIAAVAVTPTHEAAKTNGVLTIGHVKAVAQTVKTIGGFNQTKEMLDVIREVGGLKKFRDLVEAIAVTEPDRIPF